MMLRKLGIPIIATVVLIMAGCGGQIRPGVELEAELTRSSPTLDEVWEDGASAMLELGVPLDEDMYCEHYTIGGGDVFSIEVLSRDFDPVIFAIDGDGSLVAWNDDWDKEKDARIVLEDPSGLTLIVGSLDGERGDFELICEEASAGELDEFSETQGLLENGFLVSWIVDDKDSELLEDMVLSEVEYYVWLDQNNIWATGFSLEEESLISLIVDSNDFSPIIVLLGRNGDNAEYVAYNDYYEQGGARIDWVVEPGDYMVVVTSYGGTEDGEFELSMDVVDDLESLRADFITVDQLGVLFEGEIEPGKSLLSTVWPDVVSGEYYDVYATGAEPCAVFEFDIDLTGFYELTASGDMRDISVILLRQDDAEEDELEYLAYSGYSTDGKYNTRLSRVMTPGPYLAICYPYYGGQNAVIGFRLTETGEAIERLPVGETRFPYLDYMNTQVVYSFSARPGRSYVVTAISEYVDPVVELYLGEDDYLMDDDSYGGYDSMLRFSVEDETDCILIVRGYSDWEEGEVQVELEYDDSAQVPVGRRLEGREEHPDTEEPPPSEEQDEEPAQAQPSVETEADI